MNFKFFITFIVIGLVAFVANARDREFIRTTKPMNVYKTTKNVDTFFFILKKTSEKKNNLL